MFCLAIQIAALLTVALASDAQTQEGLHERLRGVASGLSTVNDPKRVFSTKQELEESAQKVLDFLETVKENQKAMRDKAEDQKTKLALDRVSSWKENTAEFLEELEKDVSTDVTKQIGTWKSQMAAFYKAGFGDVVGLTQTISSSGQFRISLILIAFVVIFSSLSLLE